MAKRKNNNSDIEVRGLLLLGALALIATLASKKAYKNAENTDIPLVIEEDNKLYKIYSDGRKILIKNLPKSNRSIPSNFTLR